MRQDHNVQLRYTYYIQIANLNYTALITRLRSKERKSIKENYYTLTRSKARQVDERRYTAVLKQDREDEIADHGPYSSYYHLHAHSHGSGGHKREIQYIYFT